MQNFNDSIWDRYYRDKPIKEFDLNQTMYSLVKNESLNNEKLYATGFCGNNMTYGSLIESSDILAQAFNDIGVKEGDTVSILTINMPIVQQSLLSLSKLGATMSWIDLRCKDNDIIKYINAKDSNVIIVFEDILPLITKIIDKTNVKKVIVCSPKDYLSPIVRTLANVKDKFENKKIEFPQDKRFVRLKDFIKNTKPATELSSVKFEKDRPSIIVQSSGSTGKPKQIIHTEYNFNSAVQKMAFTDLPFYKGNTMHISIPPFIIYGLGNSIYASLAFTMKAEMNPYVSENTVYDDLGKFDISLAAPLHYRYIYQKLEDIKTQIDFLETLNTIESRRELKKVLNELKRVVNGINRAKVFVSGGDKISSEELIRMQQVFNKIIVNGYGNNEVLGAAIVSPMYANKPGSIGIPMKGVNIKVVDQTTDNELSYNQVGELYVSTDNLFIEYLGNTGETKRIKAIDDNGNFWIKTGDLASIDDDGYIIHKGRNMRLINKEAFKICPDTIEEVINSLPFIKECVVVGVEDEKSGMVPFVFVTLLDKTIDQSKCLEIIKNKCKVELPEYEVPSYYEIVDNMIYTQNDKLDFINLTKKGNEMVKRKILK